MFHTQANNNLRIIIRMSSIIHTSALDHSIMYRELEPVCHTTETNVMLTILKFLKKN